MSGLYWPVAAIAVPMPNGQSFDCETLAPVRTNVIEAGLTVVVPGMSQSPALPAEDVERLRDVDARLAHLPRLHVRVVGLQLQHANLRTQPDCRARERVVEAVFDNVTYLAAHGALLLGTEGMTAKIDASHYRGNPKNNAGLPSYVERT